MFMAMLENGGQTHGQSVIVFLAGLHSHLVMVVDVKWNWLA